ncbi:2OG-Fe(II) oxygenase [Sphingomonas sp.]|uniref:prolyl hydroxylase family protein n=1 Tax=Sphingomonas sp. TaxID=28214 RepID=UPI001ECFA25D|nr:2OG-Fe(II) oxygenase [Sphingomonas sp.]MBX3592992.1 2OG-Fe(II) oxygenase [Sphingomonas sp.]
MAEQDPVRTLIDAGQVDDAIAMVERGARADDPAMLYRLADWRLFGLYGPQDFAAAHGALARAAATGSARAAHARAYLVAAGLGCAADFDAARAMLAKVGDEAAARQLALLDTAPTLDQATRAPREILSEAPLIVRIEGFASAAECDWLVACGEPALQPALVVDPRTREGVPDPVRTSHAMSILAMDEDLVVHNINRRIAAATGTSPRQGEPLNVLRYMPGQQFRRHHDAYAGAPGANQRILTALIWLNDGYIGGETVFPDIGVSVTGRRGDALVFRNTLNDGRRDERGWHAGAPVERGVKWLASRWIRAGLYTPE